MSRTSFNITGASSGIGIVALRGLARSCMGKPARGGQNALQRLRSGLTPRKGTEWPLGIGVGPPSGPIAPGSNLGPLAQFDLSPICFSLFFCFGNGETVLVPSKL